MATTPPPAGRIHTPPAPLHGPRYDGYEPYSPRRRSVRVREQKHYNEPQSPPRARQPHHARLQANPTSTPRRPTLKSFESSQTLSPPSSPETAHRQKAAPPSILSHEEQHEEEDAPAMYPTPRKTPRKQLNETSRLLHFRSQAPNGLLPTPRKHRVRNTLDSPEDPLPPIPVYTDSRERIPDMARETDNPFAGPQRPQRRSSRPLRKIRNEEEAEIYRRADAGEGVVFMFRGRPSLRPFTDKEGINPDDEELHSFSTQSARIRHLAGASAQRPITRSHLEPRRLFTDADAEDSHTADEEATTDIEDHARDDELTQSSNMPTIEITSSQMSIETEEALIDGSVVQRRKKPSPFDSWPRKKAGSSSPDVAKGPQTRKRSAEPTAADTASGKRTRSGAQVK